MHDIAQHESDCSIRLDASGLRRGGKIYRLSRLGMRRNSREAQTNSVCEGPVGGGQFVLSGRLPHGKSGLDRHTVSHRDDKVPYLSFQMIELVLFS